MRDTFLRNARYSYENNSYEMRHVLTFCVKFLRNALFLRNAALHSHLYNYIPELVMLRDCASFGLREMLVRAYSNAHYAALKFRVDTRHQNAIQIIAPKN